MDQQSPAVSPVQSLSPPRKRAPGTGGKEYTAFEAIEIAARMIKAAGFVLRYASMQSEACYYGWPGRTGMLRIAAHKGGKRSDGMGRGPVWARLTIYPDHGRKNLLKIEHATAMAIGFYFLRANTP